MRDLVAQLGLQLVKVVFVGFVEFFADVGKVHHVAIAEIFVGAVHAGERLQEVVRLDDAAEIEFFQALGIKAGEQHVVNKQKVNLASLEVFHPLFALILGANVMQNQRGIFDAVCQKGASGVAFGL